jgi:hypothetical protein
MALIGLVEDEIVVKAKKSDSQAAADKPLDMVEGEGKAAE